MRTVRLVVALVLGAAVSTALAEQTPPTENKGMSAKQLAGFDLAKQGLKDYDQRQMRLRQITLEPGGVVASHSHSQRPALSYILKGALTEHRKGSEDRTYQAGEVITESTDVDHWAENKGTDAVVIVSVDLFKE
jgi:quercetin dioxygenase-like cupin family protein